jgi:uncharacterized transporter YbjL
MLKLPLILSHTHPSLAWRFGYKIDLPTSTITVDVTHQQPTKNMFFSFFVVFCVGVFCAKTFLDEQQQVGSHYTCSVVIVIGKLAGHEKQLSKQNGCHCRSQVLCGQNRE